MDHCPGDIVWQYESKTWKAYIWEETPCGLMKCTVFLEFKDDAIRQSMERYGDSLRFCNLTKIIDAANTCPNFDKFKEDEDILKKLFSKLRGIHSTSSKEYSIHHKFIEDDLLAVITMGDSSVLVSFKKYKEGLLKFGRAVLNRRVTVAKYAIDFHKSKIVGGPDDEFFKNIFRILSKRCGELYRQQKKRQQKFLVKKAQEDVANEDNSNDHQIAQMQVEPVVKYNANLSSDASSSSSNVSSTSSATSSESSPTPASNGFPTMEMLYEYLEKSGYFYQQNLFAMQQNSQMMNAANNPPILIEVPPADCFSERPLQENISGPVKSEPKASVQQTGFAQESHFLNHTSQQTISRPVKSEPKASVPQTGFAQEAHSTPIRHWNPQNPFAAPNSCISFPQFLANHERSLKNGFIPLQPKI